ncbi:unnamed protein product [Lepidochelys kempii]
MLPKCSHLWGGTRHLPNSPQHPGEGQEVKVSAVQVWNQRGFQAESLKHLESLRQRPSPESRSAFLPGFLLERPTGPISPTPLHPPPIGIIPVTATPSLVWCKGSMAPPLWAAASASHWPERQPRLPADATCTPTTNGQRAAK